MLLMGMAGCGGENTEQGKETTLPPVAGFVVPTPMAEWPTYTVSKNPTVKELRETSVRAMQDMLSILLFVKNYPGR